jgi:cobaltochelatase CobS
MLGNNNSNPTGETMHHKPHTPYTKGEAMNYQDMSVMELRSELRRRNNEHKLGIMGTMIIGLTKFELVEALSEIDSTGEAPASLRKGNDDDVMPDPAPVIPDKAIDDKVAKQLGEALSGVISTLMASSLDEGRVIEIIRQETGATVDEIKSTMQGEIDRLTEFVESLAIPTRVTIEAPDMPDVDMGLQHEALPKLINLVRCGLNVWMAGPAGSGKTYAGEAVAKAFGREFFCQSVNIQTTKSDLLGFTTATGETVRTAFREAYENGGVFLLDEVDAGNANVLTVLNAALSNGQCLFPDGMVKKHDDFIMIAAGNTWGRGATSQYVGRNPIDEATRSRFAFLPFDYDEALEKQLTGNDEWFDRVKAIREVVFSNGEKVVVSPRASINGAKMLAAGFTREECEDTLIFQGCNTEVKARILNGVA